MCKYIFHLIDGKKISFLLQIHSRSRKLEQDDVKELIKSKFLCAACCTNVYVHWDLFCIFTSLTLNQQFQKFSSRRILFSYDFSSFPIAVARDRRWSIFVWCTNKCIFPGKTIHRIQSNTDTINERWSYSKVDYLYEIRMVSNSYCCILGE